MGLRPSSRTLCPLIPSASQGAWRGHDLHPSYASEGALGQGTPPLQCCCTAGLVPQFPQLQKMRGTCAVCVTAVPLPN